MTQLERWATEIGSTLQNIDVVAAINMVDAYRSGESETQYYRHAERIAEPVFSDPYDSAEYCTWIEECPDDWAAWVSSTFGEAWGVIADSILEDIT